MSAKGKRNSSLARRIVERAAGVCAACRRPSNIRLQAHHITPLCQGGADTADNMIALCPPCHVEADRAAGLHAPDPGSKPRVYESCVLCGDVSRRIAFNLCGGCRAWLVQLGVEWTGDHAQRELMRDEGPPECWKRI